MNQNSMPIEQYALYKRVMELGREIIKDEIAIHCEFITRELVDMTRRNLELYLLDLGYPALHASSERTESENALCVEISRELSYQLEDCVRPDVPQAVTNIAQSLCDHAVEYFNFVKQH